MHVLRHSLNCIVKCDLIHSLQEVIESKRVFDNDTKALQNLFISVDRDGLGV